MSCRDNSRRALATTTVNSGSSRVWRGKNILGGMVAAAVLALCLPAQAQITTGYWNVTSGSWSTPGNWVSSLIPTNTGDVANFSNHIAAAATVLLDTNRTVGILNIGDNAVTAAYTLSPTGATTFSFLTLDNGGAAAPAQINETALADSDIIGVPLLLNSNLAVSSAAAGQTFTISGSAINQRFSGPC